MKSKELFTVLLAAVGQEKRLLRVHLRNPPLAAALAWLGWARQACRWLPGVTE